MYICILQNTGLPPPPKKKEKGKVGKKTWRRVRKFSHLSIIYIMQVISHSPKKNPLYYSCHLVPMDYKNSSPISSSISYLINSHLFTSSLLPSTTQNPSCQGLPPPFRFRPLLTDDRHVCIPSLGPIHTFLTRNLTHPSQQAAFGKLSAYSLRHAILNGIDVFVSGDFCCLEFICIF